GVRILRPLLGLADRRPVRAGVHRHGPAPRGRPAAARGEGLSASVTRALAGALAVLALLARVPLAGAAPRDGRAGAAAEQGRDAALRRLEARYATLLFEHRPDLAAHYALPGRAVRFAPLDEATIDAHLRGLRELLAAADSIGRIAGERPGTS